MEPGSFGRRMGIGVRVASNILRERSRRSASTTTASSPVNTQPEAPSFLAADGNYPPPPGTSSNPVAASTSAAVADVDAITAAGPRPPRPTGKSSAAAYAAAQKTRSVGRASKRFGEAIWGPLVHVSGVLWLEVTGMFFGLFALFFAQNVYRLRHAYATGDDHRKFLLYAAITVVFLYFTFTSFYRARRKGKYAKR